MKLSFKKLVTVILIMTTISCNKELLESSSVQSSLISDESSGQALTTDINEPGKYMYITIGAQKWMSANLTVTRYRNGDRIPRVNDAAKWATLTTGAWCWYNNDSATYAATYGKLYNWYAVNDPRGLAPKGWHVPSDLEWDALSTHLGSNSSGKLKEAGTTHWRYPNTRANNKTGFTALPGGFRNYDGTYFDIGINDNLWTSTEANSTDAFHRFLSYITGNVGRSQYDKRLAFSVRCLRD